VSGVLPLSRRFLAETWRKRPFLLRAALPDEMRAPLTFARFHSWCAEPVRVRVYVRTEGAAPGTAQARILRHPSDGLAIYDHFSRLNEPITVLLNGIETVDPLLVKLQTRFGIPYDWRRDDIVATLSAPSAGIGYHGGSEDGFILQLQGERHWSVWPPDVLSAGYRDFLCGNPVEPPPDPRTKTIPLLSVRLMPGDALYVPALFPHEGITIAESLSLSLAWRGLSAYRVFQDLYRVHHGPGIPPLAPTESAALYRLLDDPPLDSEAEPFLCSELVNSFQSLPEKLRPSEGQIHDFVSLIMLRRLGFHEGSANLNTRV
jgi:ribosomal protein L16 Arg81 hydroxylase